MKLLLYNIFFLFFIFFEINAHAREDILEKTKEILQQTEFAPYLDSIVRTPGIKFNLFFMMRKKQRYVIKVMRNNRFLLVREKFCSEFAKRAGLDDAIIPVEHMYGNNTLIISKYCYFNPFLKQHAVSLCDALEYAKEKERIIPKKYIEFYKKKLWKYNANNQEYDIKALDQFNFEKALVFSFITLQWDQHRKNVLLQISSEHPLVVKIKLIDFSNSMTENNDVAHHIWPGRVVHACCLLHERLFKKYLNKAPSAEIKKIVHNLHTINYDDLFTDFEDEYREIDRKDFLSRITDLIDAFNVDHEKSIGEIMSDLFKNRYPFNTIHSSDSKIVHVNDKIKKGTIV